MGKFKARRGSHLDREYPLQGGFIIPPCSVALRSTNNNQATSQIPDIFLHSLHLCLREAICRKIVENKKIEGR